MSKQQFLFLTAGALLLASCATPGKPPPTPLEVAQLSVARADEARVGDYAGLEMRAAREKLAAARGAARRAQGDDAAAHEAAVSSRQFAEEATAATELAVARARGARLQAAIVALQQQLGMVRGPTTEVTPDMEPAIVPPPEELEPSGPPALPPATVDSPGSASVTIPTGPPPVDRPLPPGAQP